MAEKQREKSGWWCSWDLPRCREWEESTKSPAAEDRAHCLQCLVTHTCSLYFSSETSYFPPEPVILLLISQNNWVSFSEPSAKHQSSPHPSPFLFFLKIGSWTKPSCRLCLWGPSRQICSVYTCSVHTCSSIRFGLPGRSETSVWGMGAGGNWIISGLWGLVGICVSRELLKAVHWDYDEMTSTSS